MFEEQLQRAMFSQNSEKSFVDKILDKKTVDDIRSIIKKPRLTRSELLELLYLLSSTESKLLNFGEWDRYVILKFFVWIREFVKIAELLYDYRDDLERKRATCVNCGCFSADYLSGESLKRCDCDEFEGVMVLNERTERLLSNNERLIEHNVKFLIDLYFNVGRSSLSLGATGFMEILKNKYEFSYPQQGGLGTDVREKQGSILKLKK